jgi:excinuclease ABC subunit C
VTVIKNKLTNLPAKPGVYLFKNKSDKVIYVGKAKNLKNRVRSYFQNSLPFDPKTKILIKNIADLDFIITDSEIEALILEANLIKEHKPRYNINLKDDKSFPYIRITKEDFPQVFPTRKIVRDGSTYLGPYTNVKDMRFALTTLKSLFTIRSCKFDLNSDVVAKKKVPLCLEYYIKKCKGPCQGLQDILEYQKTIDKVKQFLKGKTDNLLSELKAEMISLSTKQKYEDAARVRDNIEALEKYRNSQKVVMNDYRDRDLFALALEDDDACTVIFKIREGKIVGRMHYYLKGTLHKSKSDVLEHFINQYYNSTEELPVELFLPLEIEGRKIIENWLTGKSGRNIKIIIPRIGEKKKLMDMCTKNARYLLEELKLQKAKADGAIPYAVQSLQRDLKLAAPPRRIECFDISNIQGSDPVASMICFIDGRPKKSEYRKFKITGKETPDDFAMMREVITRRYTRILREKKPLPDLIVVDGGKGQLSSALTVLKKLKLGKQPLIGLAKRLEEIFIPGLPDAQMLPKTSSSLKLLQNIRDEAHRFAITYHRTLRKKRTISSALDEIPGIGPNRRNQLLKIFGSVKAIRESNPDQIHKDSGIPLKLAELVHHTLQEKNS